MDNPDLSHQWLPFTANRAFAADPRLLVSAEGVYYRDAGGRQLLDSVSGLFCVPAGHGRPEIASAVSEQMPPPRLCPPVPVRSPRRLRPGRRALRTFTARVGPRVLC